MKYYFIVAFLIHAVYSVNESVIGTHCQDNRDCDPPFIVCSRETNTCAHKRLFPMEFYEFIGTIATSVLGSLSAAAGIGGGVVAVPLFLLFFGVTMKEAVALSNVIILINAFIMFIFAIGKKDPLKPTKTLIDYNFVMLFNPIFVFSNVLGNIITKMVSSGDIIIIFIVVIISMIIFNIFNWRKKYNQENEELRKAKEAINDEEEDVVEDKHQSVELIMLPTKKQRDNHKNISVYELLEKSKNLRSDNFTEAFIEADPNSKQIDVEKIEEDARKLERIIIYEGKDFDPIKYGYFFMSILILFVFSLIKGTNGFPSLIGIRYCSILYWIVVGLMGGSCLLLAYFSTIHVLEEIRIKKKFGHLLPHEMNYNFTQAIYINCIIMGIGILSNMLGLSGGVVTYPLFTAMGVQPLVVSFSSLFMVLLNKVAAVMLNLLSGLIIKDLAIYFIIIMGLSSVFMISKLNAILKKYKRQSIITLIMIGILFTSLIITPLYAVIEGSKSDDFWVSPGYCK